MDYIIGIIIGLAIVLPIACFGTKWEKQQENRDVKGFIDDIKSKSKIIWCCKGCGKESNTEKGIEAHIRKCNI